MKTGLIIVGILFALVGLAGLVLYLLGRSLPERHRMATTVRLGASREVVWDVITDYARIPEWWPAVKSSRVETRPDGEVLTWNTDGRGQKMAFHTKEEHRPARLVREIVGDQLAFGGTWTFELSQDGTGTQLTLTEDGFIRPPFFRAVAQYFIGLDRTQKDFLAHLERRVAAEK